MTSSTLVLVTPNPTYTPPSKAAKLYAVHLASNSIYVNVSVFPLKLFHASSNRTEAAEGIEISFPRWAKSQGIRIDPALYDGFLRNLPKRVMTHIPQILGTAFRPCNEGHFIDHAGAHLANTFVPFRPATLPAPAELSILEEYFDRTFENDQDRKTTLQFLAHIIQQPMVRPQWGLLITGAMGCGKSSLSDLLKAALGARHVYSHNEYAPAFAKFSEILPNNLMVCFDDADSNKGTYEDLKLAVTRTTMPVEIKGVQGHVEREVYARIGIFSNSPRPFPYPADDRRFYVLEPMTHKSKHNLTGCPANTADFFVRFRDWITSADTPATLYHYFNSIDLSDFKPGSTLKTATHKLMAGLSLSVIDTLIEGFLTDHEDYRFHQNELLAYLKENSVPYPNVDSLKLKLANLGYEHKRRDIKEGKEKISKYWVWQPIVLPRSPSLNPDEETRIKEAANPTF